MSDYYSAEELAQKIRMTAQTLKIWAREGRIPSYMPGNKYLFDKKEMETWIKSQKGAYVENKDKE